MVSKKHSDAIRIILTQLTVYETLSKVNKISPINFSETLILQNHEIYVVKWVVLFCLSRTTSNYLIEWFYKMAGKLVTTKLEPFLSFGNS